MANATDEHDLNESARLTRAIGMVILALLLFGCFIVMRPFLSALLWAIVLSFAIWPAHRRLVGWLGGRRALAALLITLIIAAALVVPLTIAVANLANDARALTSAGRRWLESMQPAAPAWVRNVPFAGTRAAQYWEAWTAEVSSLLRRDAQDTPTTAPAEQSKLLQTFRSILLWTKSWLIAFGLAIGEGVVQVALSLLLTFFILKDGEALAVRLTSMAQQISGDRGATLLHVARDTVRGVIYGILGTALAQGIMAGVGFLIAGVPGATLLGLLTFFFSVLPMGPPLIWGAAAFWLFQRGDIGWGIFMIIWGLGVSSIDNVVKPWIISRGSKMPFVLIFFGVLGGALTFGLIGVFIGPTLLAVAYRLIDEWSSSRIPVPLVAQPDNAATRSEPCPPKS